MSAPDNGQEDVSNTKGQPPRWKLRQEPNPDVSFSISAVPSVVELVKANNAETKPRRRLRPTEFLNHAFVKIGCAAAARRDMVQEVMQFLHEFVHVHHTLPKNTSLSRVLYAWCEGGLVDEGVSLIRYVVDCKNKVPAAFAASFEERVVAVSMRLLLKSSNSTTSEAMIEVLRLLPRDACKRRVVAPLFERAAELMNSQFAMEVLRMALERDLELWDADFHYILRTMKAEVDASGSDAKIMSHAKSCVEEVLAVMEQQHPVVGALNAALVRTLLNGQDSVVDAETGVCSSCGAFLHSFDFSQHERETLCRDIMEKLILPRVDVESTYEPNKLVSPEVRASRLVELEQFKNAAAAMEFDAILDGANVGYYGLSSWYQEAKEAKLRSHGVDVASVPLSVRTNVPFPVDVAPKFSLIDDMRKAVVRAGKRPIIVLHQRHVQHMSSENEEVLRQWMKDGVLLASPTFLNDDYCWLYAAVSRPETFIVSNDQMRDHHFLMLSKRFFIRWRQRHRITYKALYHKATRTAVLALNMPRPFSVWVQRHQPEAGSPTSHHWHVPFIATIPVIDQATNRVTSSENEMDLSKDGDDECSGWVCTWRSQ